MNTPRRRALPLQPATNQDLPSRVTCRCRSARLEASYRPAYGIAEAHLARHGGPPPVPLPARHAGVSPYTGDETMEASERTLARF